MRWVLISYFSQQLKGGDPVLARSLQDHVLNLLILEKLGGFDNLNDCVVEVFLIRFMANISLLHIELIQWLEILMGCKDILFNFSI